MSRGDHLRVYRGYYWHHGIDLGDDEVMHFDGEPKAKSDARICRTSLQEFIGNSDTIEELDRKCYTAHPDVVVKRAYRLEGSSDYNLLANNCEHFALYCKTGGQRSEQIEDFFKEMEFYEEAIPVPIINSIVGATATAGRAAAANIEYTYRDIVHQMGGPDKRQEVRETHEAFRGVFRSFVNHLKH